MQNIAYNLYLFYRKQNFTTNPAPDNVFNDNIIINKCNNCKNCISCNIHLKCVNEQIPWNGLFIPEQIDSAIDKVNYFK